MYKYKAIYQNKLIEGTIEAKSEKEALQDLKHQGFLVLSLEKAKNGKDKRKKVDYKFLEKFTRDFIQLMEAGIPIEKTLMFLAESNKKYKEKLIEASFELRKGGSLYEALLTTDLFPKDYLELIRAGEESGNLIETLKLIYGFIYELNAFKKNLINSLIYPIFLAIVTILSLAILSIYVIPKFRLLFETADKELPLLTKFVFVFSENFNNFISGFLVVLLVLLVMFKISMKIGNIRFMLENLLLKIPFIGNKLIIYDLIKISNSMYTLLKGGIALDKAIHITSEVPSLMTLREVLKNILNQVSEGSSLSKAFARYNIFPELAIEIIHVGEESGELAGAWYQIYITFSEEFKNSIQRIITFIEPIIILIMGIFIGLIVFGMILGVFSITGYI